MTMSPQEFANLWNPELNGFNNSINGSNAAFNDAFTQQKITDGVNAYLKFNSDSLKDTIGVFTPVVTDIAGTVGQSVGTIGGSLLSGLTNSLGISEPVFIGICLVGAYIVFIK